ncbi:receptor-like serine/threonine-protein kinase SD1-7 [Ipomoea triloba]|uniref:receptor-like serine/threonine-protein kinase SD1-7 n=1 Tax=Ipomoea triloba TaxID=35885 RepID=UPI00125D2D43|nr:receptor-like serine/threonine-protein kinase SD1-7 [Ipomoea triloba]
MGRIILYDSLVVAIVCCLFIWHGLLQSGVSAKNTLAPGEFLLPTDDDYLESSNKLFKLKFMKRPGSGFSSAISCFLSIEWASYAVTSTSEETTIWVAWLGETETWSYISDLIMKRDGRLLISDDVDQELVVNDDQQYPFVMNTTATLLDTGNLVLRGGGRTLWQSFDHSTGNTWMPGMKLGWFGLKKTPQQQRCLTSWTSEENPSPGAFRLCVDPNNTKQLVAMRRGVVYWHSGVWNGNNFPFLQVDFFHSEFVQDKKYTMITSYIDCDSNDNEGCLRSPKQSNCSAGDMFNSTTGFIEWNLWERVSLNTTLNIGDCKEMCIKNCSYTAYATLEESDGTGCKFSSSTKYHYASHGDTLYLRYAAISVDTAPIVPSMQQLAGHDEELPFFDFKSIELATNYFSQENKLGQGGFGPVYKGILANGQEIAAKRLSKMSGHGVEQFKNEVLLISKLQHRNLVRLMGCCIQGDERILIYEYLPNKSLDSILFDARKKVCLDWGKRTSIISGIAQGLLYLHKYSRLRIIHRDLKTSNILLDVHMHPKISDFATARIFKDSDSRANTKSIIGTYGYMSPEYVMDGCFSEKSDVFSFGVMIMEIVSGKRNNGFYNPDRVSNLLGYAWDLWIEGKISDLIDQTMDKMISVIEATRYIQVGLLCVQDSATDRPTMTDVVSMLGNESTILPIPKQPGFSAIIGLKYGDVANNSKPCSLNEVTITEIEGR